MRIKLFNSFPTHGLDILPTLNIIWGFRNEHRGGYLIFGLSWLVLGMQITFAGGSHRESFPRKGIAMRLAKAFTYFCAVGSALFAIHMIIHCIILAYR